MIPSAVLVVVFVLAPLAIGFGISLTRWDGIADPKWVGITNFSRLAGSSDFHRIVLNNLVLLLGVIPWVVGPLLLSILVFNRRGAVLLRAIFLIPIFLPPVIVGRMFTFVLEESGPLNGALSGAGLGGLALDWLTNDRLVLLSVVVVVWWATFGLGVLLYTAGLATMSQDLVDAALVDGANWSQLVRHVYEPALRPITRFWVLLLIITTISSMFPTIYGLTRGGPGIASTTFDYRIFVTGLQTSDYGTGSAIAVISLVFLIGALGITRFLFRRDPTQ